MPVLLVRRFWLRYHWDFCFGIFVDSHQILQFRRRRLRFRKRLPKSVRPRWHSVPWERAHGLQHKSCRTFSGSYRWCMHLAANSRSISVFHLLALECRSPYMSC